MSRRTIGLNFNQVCRAILWRALLMRQCLLQCTTGHPCPLDSDTEDAKIPRNMPLFFARGMRTDKGKGEIRNSSILKCFFNQQHVVSQPVKCKAQTRL